MARKHPLKCGVGTKRFTVIRVDDPRDASTDGYVMGHSYAGRSFQEALDRAQPDRGAHLKVYVTCARDAGAARLPGNYRVHGKLVKSIRYKRGG